MEIAAIDMVNEIIVESDAEKSLNNLLRVTNKVIDKYYPNKKLNKKEYKQTLKPWITSGILKSIKRKDELYRKYINCKNINTKTAIHIEYKALKIV